MNLLKQLVVLDYLGQEPSWDIRVEGKGRMAEEEDI
jgi:hypothetical protein